MQSRVLNATTERLKPAEIPANAVYIGGRTRNGWPSSKWRNQFTIGRDGSRSEVVEKYRAWLCDQPVLLEQLPELKGRDLVCWCAPLACHGDVLLEMVNRHAA